MTAIRTPGVVAVLIVSTMTSLALAQNPKPPTPLPVDIQSVEQLPMTDAVVLWIDGNNITVFVDSTSNPEDQSKITTLEVKWEGPGPGFREENCDWRDCELVGCTRDKLAMIRTRGSGPIYVSSCWDSVIPDGYLETWNPETSWIVDGSYLTGGTLDKFDPNSPYFGPIPEPSSWTLLCIGLLLLRRRL